jgi:hypothetical protein
MPARLQLAMLGGDESEDGGNNRISFIIPHSMTTVRFASIPRFGPQSDLTQYR